MVLKMGCKIGLTACRNPGQPATPFFMSLDGGRICKHLNRQLPIPLSGPHPRGMGITRIRFLVAGNVMHTLFASGGETK